MVHIDPRHVKDCDCEDYPCCGHTDNIPSDEPEYCDACGGSGHNDLYCRGWDDDEEDEDDSEELPANLTQITALVEPINDAIDNLLEDTLMENILDFMRLENIGCGEFEADQAIAEIIYNQCVEVIGERFKKVRG